ncbi:MAG: glutathione S-transferase family protein [Granulosicoccus sp.]|nr:glutathione S-transferase family protein [Granulosicoccus sp.]
MKLFGHPDSGHAYKVKLFLSLTDTPHAYELIDIFSPRESRPQEFRENSRYQEVPLLLDDGQAYVQSAAILCHLASQSGHWGAQNTQLYQRCLEWLFWESNKIGLCLPQLRANKKFADSRLKPDAEEWLLARYHHDVNLLEQELADDRPWITGDDLTIADFSLCGYLFYASEAELTPPEKVQNWLDRIAAQPGWQEPYTLLAQTG